MASVGPGWGAPGVSRVPDRPSYLSVHTRALTYLLLNLYNDQAGVTPIINSENHTELDSLRHTVFSREYSW
jgi:hypothetical protein